MRTWRLIWSLNILLHYGKYKLWAFLLWGNVQLTRLSTHIFPHMFSLNLWNNKTFRALLVRRGTYVYSCLCLETICTHKNALVFNGFYFLMVSIYFFYICICLSKLLLSGQRTSATSWPMVIIYTPQTRSLYDITATFLTVLWARNRTGFSITSWCVTSSNLKIKWILRENYFVSVYCIQKEHFKSLYSTKVESMKISL